MSCLHPVYFGQWLIKGMYVASVGTRYAYGKTDTHASKTPTPLKIKFKIPFRVWRDGSVVQSACCSPREPRSVSQHPSC